MNPGKSFLDNWHLDLFCEYLEAVRCGDIKRLIINVPPRSLKSISINVAWPAWLIGNKPSLKIISASYSQAISNKHSLDCKNVIFSDWYRQVFTELEIKTNIKSKFMTSMHGFRMATSVGGTLTGEGADLIIVDDPLTPMQAMSCKLRERANNWFKQSLISRLNSRKDGAIILVMQRLHQDDLSGVLLKEQNWEHLCIPAISTQESKINFGKVNFIRKEGDLLHSTRDGNDEIKRLKQELGSYTFSAQYQQSPHKVENGIIKNEWFIRYEDRPIFEKIDLFRNYGICI